MPLSPVASVTAIAKPSNLRVVWRLVAQSARATTPLTLLAILLVTVARWVPAIAGVVLARKGVAWGLAAGLAGATLDLARTWVAQQSSSRFRTEFTHDVVHRLCSRSAMSYAPGQAGRTQASLFVAVQSGARVVTAHGPTLIGDCIAALTLAPLLLMQQSPGWLFAFCPALLLAALVSTLLRRSTTQATLRAWDHMERLADTMAVLLLGQLELQAAGKAQKQAARTARQAALWSQLELRAERLSSLGGRLPAAILIGTAVLVFFMWARDLSPQLLSGLSKGLVFASAVAIALSVGHAVADGSRCVNELASFAASLDRPAAPLAPPNARAIDPLAPIHFNSVSFGYRPDQLALHRMDFSWNPGECLALTGANGSGKSTVLKLLLRLADPQAGHITVGGTDLRDADPDTWRSSISYLPQKPFLPEHATIRDALRLFDDSHSDHELMQALDRVQIAAVIHRRNSDDPLSVPVQQLSAGERQRVALARALLSSAPVLLLDEPDAYLDAAGLDRLVEIVRHEASVRRVLIVAHTQQLVRLADRIVAVDQTSSTCS